MRFLILNIDYPEFLHWLYGGHKGLYKQSYEEQMHVRIESLFGVADFYSSNLRKLGHEALDIHANNEFMQRAWAREHCVQVKEQKRVVKKWMEVLQQARTRAARTPLRYFRSLFSPVLHSLDSPKTWFYTMLAAQIRYYKPDILLNQAMDSITSRFLREMKSNVRLLVGQIASPIPQGEDFSCYDLVISSLPNFVDYFRKLGIPGELSRFAFEPRVLRKIDRGNRDTITVSFIGALSHSHEARMHWLEYLCGRVGIQIWGAGIDSFSKNSLISQHYIGKAWGIEMYQVLQRSKIILNHHIDVAGNYANNMRLFEATGMGTLLITDWKVNLHEMFEPGKEVVAYRNPEECAELIKYYLEHDEEWKAIARAGQKRTLKEHTYYQRMQELVDIVQKYL